jgi:two-component system CheB/CheR fusion protein
MEAQREFDQRLLTQYAPAAVFVNEDFEIVHSRGPVDRYLKLGTGRASLAIFKMAREGLLYDLRNALTRAKKGRTAVRKQKIQMKEDGKVHEINFEVVPMQPSNANEYYYMIRFEDAQAVKAAYPPSPRERMARGKRNERQNRLTKLEQELAATKEYLHSVIESQEATNEELQSANEEILSSNEELQSTNEELETAKEELQSANEELTTVNDELRNRNSEVTQANNDLTNLLASANLGTVMLGSDLTIRRFTPTAQNILGLIPTDIGRPFTNINTQLDVGELQALIVEVMEKVTVVEREIVDRNGARYLMRILPYRTQENQIDGAVITFIENNGSTH